MKKVKSASKKRKDAARVSPEEAVRFLEDMRLMAHDLDEPTIAISLRIPGNLLRSLKTKAKADGKKYQSLLIEYVRKGLRS